MVVYHASDILHLLFRQLVTAVEHLREAHDDVERRADLMRHILYECGLLTAGFLGHHPGLLQFLVALCRLGIHLADIADMAVERLLHLCKAVLQPSYHIAPICVRNVLIVASLGNPLRLLLKLHQGPDGLGDGGVAEPEDEYQPDDQQGHDDIGKLTVAGQYIAVRTDEGQTPIGTPHWLIADQAGLAIDNDPQCACLALCHLMAQSHDVRVLTDVDVVEDGPGEQPRRIRMDKIAAIGAEHHEIGMRIRLLGRDDLGEPT